MPAVKSNPKLAETLKSVKLPKQRTGPLWAGPCGDGPQGGVTQSMLSRYLVCKERFRVMVIEGLKPAERFSAPLHFGDIWHAAEEAHAAGEDWEQALLVCVEGFRRRFPMEMEPILHWYSVAQELFPIYVEHWAEHPDVKDRTPLLQEQEFDLPYPLPSGRTVRLRGKWDSVDLIGKGRAAGVWVQENKTKSSIDRQKVERQLTFDLQTMVYLIALDNDKWMSRYKDMNPKTPILGVRYNVIRRSAHKSTESMLKKLNEDRADGRINEWFSRWSSEVSAKDVMNFKTQCLDPELENLCDDYEWWAFCKLEKENVFDFSRRAEFFGGKVWDGGKCRTHIQRHARRPFGVYDVLAEGGSTDLDEYLATGSEAGLKRIDDLFPEIHQK